MSSGRSTCRSFWHMPPPTGPNSFIFTYVFTEKCPCQRLASPPTRVGVPPMGNPGSTPDEVYILNAVLLSRERELFTSHWGPLGNPGGAASTPSPQQDPILSFSHMFLLKSTHIGGQHPPNGSSPPNGKSWICNCM